MLNVSTSGYYDWRDRPESHRSRKNRQLTTMLRCYHQQSRELYGSARLHQDLIDAGETCSVNRVAQLMKVADIQSKITRRFVLTTNSKNTRQPAPDLLERNFTVETINTAWVSDTTVIPIRKGWLYLAVILELFSRQVIGWSMAERNNAPLVQSALTMALLRRGKVNKVVVHSDQGSTYASGDY